MQRKKIFLIDDSTTMRKMIKKAVSVFENEFLEASNGLEGLKILKTEFRNTGVILLDWNMPEMTGIEFLAAIQTMPSYKEIPIVMLTTEAEKENVVQALQYGVKNYILKPFTNEQLVEKIKPFIG
jgi:two-component system chemotaxis response regulator CheY